MNNQDLTKNNQGSNQGDLISRSALKKAFEDTVCIEPMPYAFVKQIIDNAPTVELDESIIQEILNKRCMTVVTNEYLIALHGTRSQGEYVNISKLRLMTVEECAGHTIDYAMGWKACIEWIKKGGAE